MAFGRKTDKVAGSGSGSGSGSGAGAGAGNAAGPEREKKAEGVFKGVFVAYFILILHVVLLVVVGCMVLFFRGFVEYMLWIFLGGAALILGSGLYFLRRMRQEKKSVGEMLRSPTFRDRSVEVSFLGGLASVKLGRPGNGGAHPGQGPPLLESGRGRPPLQLEDPATARVRELGALARLLEGDLITREEYDRMKQRLLEPNF